MSEPATPEEIVAAVAEALVVVNVPPAAVDILHEEYLFPQLTVSEELGIVRPDGSTQGRAIPVHIAIVKSTGMILPFVAAGPAGIHARILRMRQEKAAKDGSNGHIPHLGNEKN